MQILCKLTGYTECQCAQWITKRQNPYEKASIKGYLNMIIRLIASMKFIFSAVDKHVRVRG